MYYCVSSRPSNTVRGRPVASVATMLKAATSASSATSLRPVTRALLSVWDKRGIVELGSALAAHGVEVLSTGNTAKTLRSGGVTVTDVSEYTGFPELMGGRVKTLHPKIHGGILAVRDSKAHDRDRLEHDIPLIDMVVSDLYPFADAVATGGDFATCIENVDIGGPTMLRAAAKNHDAVTVVTSPDQYGAVVQELEDHAGATTLATRRRLAKDAFAVTAKYDAAVADWFSGEVDGEPARVTRTYTEDCELKYGCNPHQKPAFYGRIGDTPLPFSVLNGAPGYINLLDALNAWHLVHELSAAVGLPAAASFKHVSPAGAAVAVPLSDVVAKAYGLRDAKLTPTALAYLRARNADPLCSFGDFAAVSEVVDEATARLLQPEVSDGIIAPGYAPAALDILCAKKRGNFIVLQADAGAVVPDVEVREVHGVALAQRRNDVALSPASFGPAVTAASDLPDAAVRDLLVATIALKYTQSNSVSYAVDGQVVGVGAGQQSRVDCVKLAGRKVATWFLRQHPKVLSLPFKAGVKRQQRVNARVRYIEGDMSAVERAAWLQLFDGDPEPLTADEKEAFLADLSGVALSSDAFFPFRDSIDHASKLGVQYVAQPGGSVADDAVVSACDEYGMAMTFTGTRLFHH